MYTELSSIINHLGSDGLVIGLSSLTLVLLVVLFRGYQKIQQVNKQLVRLQHDLRVANSSAISMGQQLIHLEKRVNQHPVTQEPIMREAVANTFIEETVVQQEKRPSSIGNESSEPSFSSVPPAEHTADETSVYDQARSFLAQGESVSDVAKQCGLSHAEVSLLHALSKKTIPSH